MSGADAFMSCISSLSCAGVQAFSGLMMSMILFLIACGLSLIFGVMDVINFAHGSFFMMGAYVAYTVARSVGPGAGYWVSLVVAPLVVAAVGALLEAVLLRRVYGRHSLYQLLLTFALLLVFEDLAKLGWGTGYVSASVPEAFRGAVWVMDRPLPRYYLLLLGIGPLVGLAMWLGLVGTRYGRIVQAASMDREMVMALGINARRVYTGVFGAGCWLAALAGALAAPIRSLYPGMGVEVAIESFVVVVLGGLGNIWGALVGSLIIGQLRAFATLLLPRYEIVLPFALMALVLMVRPRGLLGQVK